MTTNNGGPTTDGDRGYIELLIEAAEKGTTTDVKRVKKYLKLVEGSTGNPQLKSRLLRIGKVLDDWELIKLHLLMPSHEVRYLEGLKLNPNDTYFVQANDRLQLDKFKSYFLLMDGTDLMPKIIDLATLVSENLGETEELSTADIERGSSNLNIIYVRKNMGLMGRGNDLYINQLLNHISYRRSKRRKTLILSEVLINAVVKSGEVTPILITNDKLRTKSGKAQPMAKLEFNQEAPKQEAPGETVVIPDEEDKVEERVNKFVSRKQEELEKKAREAERAARVGY